MYIIIVYLAEARGWWNLALTRSIRTSLFLNFGGSERIRTSGTVARTHAFQACSLNHSDTLPSYNYIITIYVKLLGFLCVECEGRNYML